MQGKHIGCFNAWAGAKGQNSELPILPLSELRESQNFCSFYLVEMATF
mgnify:CR=1 FL=1